MAAGRWWPAVCVLLLAACAEKPPVPEPVVETPPPVVEEERIESQPLKYLLGRNLKPQPTRPLNVRTRCSARDGAGTSTQLDLLVKEAQVKSFAATVSLKGHGVCRFNLKDFEQAEKLPQALLRHKREPDCLVRMWEQGPRVTVAFNSCPKSCEGDAFSYLWPIVVDAKSGRCF